MSDLGNLIVGHGRWFAGQSAWQILEAAVNTDHLNELRDELIELRRIAAICACGCGPDEHLQVNSTACCSCDCQAYTPRAAGDPPQTGPASTESAQTAGPGVAA